MIDDCKANGQFDVTTMGNVSNVGLMAQKAEEYGSHDKTFEIPTDGGQGPSSTTLARCSSRTTSRPATSGACARPRTSPSATGCASPSQRARRANTPPCSGSMRTAAHDASLIDKVKAHLKDSRHRRASTSRSSRRWRRCKLAWRAPAGKDTISVTGNVLRDYLTDLFPIIELGTSAKMLSIVPLLAGGGLFETGAGGSAPKHVQQFTEENHLAGTASASTSALAVSSRRPALRRPGTPRSRSSPRA